MRPDRIVMAPPAFDDDLSFSEGVEDLAIEQLIAKAGVEALDVAVLPKTAPLDIGSLGGDSGDPSLDSLGCRDQYMFSFHCSRLLAHCSDPLSASVPTLMHPREFSAKKTSGCKSRRID